MINLSLEARALGLRLDLGDLSTGRPCLGYANGCECEPCLERAERVPEAFLEWLEREDVGERVPSCRRVARQSRQPWELAA